MTYLDDTCESLPALQTGMQPESRDAILIEYQLRYRLEVGGAYSSKQALPVVWHLPRASDAIVVTPVCCHAQLNI